MPVATATIASRLEHLRQQLPPQVKLLAVSKGHPLSALVQAHGAGQRCFAESRLQEAKPKIDALSTLEDAEERAGRAVEWHFIGQLQANKMRGIVQRFTWIHSLATVEQARRLERIAGEERRCPNILLQVKLRSDPRKQGFDPDQLNHVLPQLAHLTHVQLRGLMTITPINLEPAARRCVFRDCRCLARRLRQRLPGPAAEHFDQLSMGMSADWQDAVREGSTLVRIGSAVFGAREALAGQGKLTSQAL